MSGIRRFEEIRAWQRARELTRAIYHLTENGPLARDFALRDQLRRAALSAMTNIAEGFGRRTKADFAHFLDQARGSVVEVQSLLYVALDVSYISQQQFDQHYALAAEVISLIAAFTSYLRGRRPSSHTTAQETQ
jgi:four helix bundle protein